MGCEARKIPAEGDVFFLDFSLYRTYQAPKLIRQLVAKGQPLDVSLLTPPFPGAIASGTITASSATPVASFVTAVAVPKGAPKPDISTPAAFKKALLAAKSVGYEDPEFAIDGEGPSEAISKLGIADLIAAKIKVCAGAAAPYSPNAVCYDPSGAAGPRRATLTQDCAPNSNCFQAPAAGTGGSVFSIQKQLARGDVALAMLFPQRHASEQGQVRHRWGAAAKDLSARPGGGIPLYPRKRPSGRQGAFAVLGLARCAGDLQDRWLRAARMNRQPRDRN